MQVSTVSAMSGDALIEVATAIAMQAHYGQVDKAGSPYIWHPLAVARLAPTMPEYQHLPPTYRPLVVAVALLHDVLEDSSVTASDLLEAGVPGRAVEAVEALTHPRHEPLDRYYARVKEDPIAVVVKLADISHNSQPDRLLHLDEATRERLQAKYQKARLILSA